jgi:hypothetical protein
MVKKLPAMRIRLAAFAVGLWLPFVEVNFNNIFTLYERQNDLGLVSVTLDVRL